MGRKFEFGFYRINTFCYSFGDNLEYKTNDIKI